MVRSKELETWVKIVPISQTEGLFSPQKLIDADRMTKRPAQREKK